jgi:orotidine-5'-phosphate decarboxylase
MKYIEKLQKSVKQSQSLLCIGLDPDVHKIRDCFPSSSMSDADLVLRFCHEVIELTHSNACAYKPNLAFFEALGSKGLDIFKKVIDHIPSGKIIIADAKRGDIGNTASHYAKAYFEEFYVDALTINPLMGLDTIEPYCNYSGKAVYVLALTSNPGAKHYLRQCLGIGSFAEQIASDIAELQKSSIAHLGMVVGATYDHTLLNTVISHAPNQSLLIPGVGAQGGSVEELKQSLQDHKGIPIINSSRGIIYAGKGLDWANSVRKAAETTKNAIQEITDRYLNS